MGLHVWCKSPLPRYKQVPWEGITNINCSLPFRNPYSTPQLQQSSKSLEKIEFLNCEMIQIQRLLFFEVWREPHAHKVMHDIPGIPDHREAGKFSFQASVHRLDTAQFASRGTFRLPPSSNSHADDICRLRTHRLLNESPRRSYTTRSLKRCKPGRLPEPVHELNPIYDILIQLVDDLE